jgi:uncharacterized membrane-anchored protein YhcB (DUF1043 family)
MTPFSSDQWVLLLLAFVLGAIVGMYLLAGGKWKRRYREEASRREALEVENKRLLHESRDMERLHGAATRHPVDRDKDRGPL